jgi:hypothetical protein
MLRRTATPLQPLLLGLLATTCMLISSLAGFFTDVVYRQETPAWRAQAQGQDWANLLIVVPALLIATARLVRGSQPALHVWRGLLLYVLYSYILYAFFIHFNQLFLAYVGALGFSFYALASSLAKHRVSLPEPLPRARFARAVLMASAVLFAAMWLSQIVPANLTGSVPGGLQDVGLVVNPVHVLDLALILPAMIIAATMLRTRRAAGYLLAVPVLVFAVVMGGAIEFMFLVQWRRGMEIVVPAVVVMGAAVLASALAAWRLLRRLPSEGLR